MIIGIDASRAINEGAGIAKYNQNLIKNLAKLDKNNYYKFLFTYVKNKNKKNNLALKLTSDFVKKENKFFSIPGNLKEWLWGTCLPILSVIMGKCNLWHATSFFEATCGDTIPQIVTIHDMTTFLFPGQRGREISERLSKRAKKIITKAVKIISVSESTKKDILKFVPEVSSEKIIVTYLGADKIFRKNPKIKKQNIILTVGTIEPRKNLTSLIVAYSNLPNDIRNKFQLMIVGASGWNNNEIYKIAKPFVDSKKIIFKNYVTDIELVKLYNSAKIFVYPSLYEGFGLPVLEAMSCALPVIVSNISSLPEVVGEAAIKINPNKPAEITKSMLQLIEDDKLRHKLSEKSLLQAKKFCWEKCARETLKVYEGLQ